MSLPNEISNIKIKKLDGTLSDDIPISTEAQDSRLYANALIGNESGAIVSLDDVSPLQHKVSVSMKGKNLFDISKVKNNTYLTNTGDSLVISGAINTNSGAKLRELCPTLKAGDIVTISLKTINELGNWDTSETRLYIYFHGTKKSVYNTRYKIIEEADLDGLIQFYCGWYSTLPEEKVTEATIYDIQFELGTTATPYTPYIPDDAEVTVKSCGKNLFDISQDYFNKHYAVRVEKNDKSIILRQVGTLSSTPVYFALPNNLAGKKITISCDAFTSGVNSARVRIHWVDKVSGGVGGGYLIGDIYSGQTAKKLVLTGVVPNQPDASHSQLSLLLYAQGTSEAGLESGVTYTTTYSNIQIEIGGTATAYEPYKEGETIPTTVGETAELTNIAPNMTITTDNTGVLIDTTYNQDINIVIEKLKAEIANLTSATLLLGGVQ